MNSKVVLISGASSGIGEGTALRFASLGCWLSLTARNIRALNEVAEKCRAKGVPKDKVLVIKGDITSADDATAIVKETAEYFGKIDILVNNAGISKPAPLGEIPLDEFDEVYNTNLRSAFNMTQQALPYLKKTKGHIVNVSSISSLRCVSGATQSIATVCGSRWTVPRRCRGSGEAHAECSGSVCIETERSPSAAFSTLRPEVYLAPSDELETASVPAGSKQ
ncbi:uncharacterized protein [Dermacentor albipictus]|uniref:uncharacterized protein n=1 Tax=Dermacentor albipictus TaxID=60249 RepID=UPI0038FBF077